ncbi:unnamed protein product [Chondrus crispus]|uniref:Uncharacterized protein n=1 Tax=Chondrus crispus TaxID=2769 RepID=R7QDT9_CHOCR|nr:unnamed protein product [Chondrus crispus]CDF36682.1 unnamed protein product [Chondrus crispus]|eukprot:XP_005716501.1 unnamed protein product [Chondrus crispus]
MVSTRRSNFPSPPPNAALANALPDDPPPPPPPPPNKPANHNEESQVAQLKTINPNRTCQKKSTAIEALEDQHQPQQKTEALPPKALSPGIQDDTAPGLTASHSADPDAPDVESFAAAMSSARLQREQEGLVTSALKRKRKSRRRARLLLSPESEQNKTLSYHERSLYHDTPPRVLSAEVLQAVQGTIGAHQSSKNARRTEARLKNQKRKRASPRSTTLLKDGGVALALAGRQKIVSITANRKAGPASFLQTSLSKQGSRRVSAAMVARIAKTAEW